VGREQRSQRKDTYAPGSGVVTSAGVYRRQTGNILADGGALRRPGEKAKTPRPLEVVHSGKTTTVRLGFSLMMEARVTRDAPRGVVSGSESARSMARKSDIRSTSMLFGYDAVNMGLNMTARYRQSMGEVNDEAIIEPDDGNLS
jgi:hypothetical protein